MTRSARANGVHCQLIWTNARRSILLIVGFPLVHTRQGQDAVFLGAFLGARRAAGVIMQGRDRRPNGQLPASA